MIFFNKKKGTECTVYLCRYSISFKKLTWSWHDHYALQRVFFLLAKQCFKSILFKSPIYYIDKKICTQSAGNYAISRNHLNNQANTVQDTCQTLTKPVVQVNFLLMLSYPMDTFEKVRFVINSQTMFQICWYIQHNTNDQKA